MELSLGFQRQVYTELRYFTTSGDFTRTDRITACLSPVKYYRKYTVFQKGKHHHNAFYFVYISFNIILTVSNTQREHHT